MALAMVYGIEPYVIWKDIVGANDRKVDAVARSMAQALVDAALRESRGLNVNARTRELNLNTETQRMQRKAEKTGSNGARATRSR